MATFIKPYTETKERSEKYAQNFDRKKITITQAGHTFNLYDYIQDGREDTEIYPTLEKYGNLQPLERPAEDIISDFTENMQLRDLMEQDNKLRQLFDGLPLNEKRAFNNNYYEFKANGLQYYENKLKAEIEKNTAEETKPEVETNGEK